MITYMEWRAVQDTCAARYHVQLDFRIICGNYLLKRRIVIACLSIVTRSNEHIGYQAGSYRNDS
jgi:hypothetical protein